MWEGDPIAEAAFKSLGVNPIPLSITDVMTSLQTGLIDGVYSSPLAMLALQWFTRTRHMYDFQLANASGAVLISRRFFDRMPEDLRKLLLETGSKHLGNLTRLSRMDNKISIETLKKNGIKIGAPPSRQEVERYAEVGRKARRMLAGKLYSEDLLDRVEKSVEEFRAKKNIKP